MPIVSGVLPIKGTSATCFQGRIAPVIIVAQEGGEARRAVSTVSVDIPAVGLHIAGIGIIKDTRGLLGACRLGRITRIRVDLPLVQGTVTSTGTSVGNL